MAAPIAAQKLRHGKALCKAVFGGFVDTFNWLVDFCSSLKGDRDANPAGDGRITVDRSDPSAPVIRCTGCKGGSDSVEVVVNVEYDTTTHVFKQFKRTISGITLEPATEEQTAGGTVFTTTPLSSELLS